jgi:hypothetical protein
MINPSVHYSPIYSRNPSCIKISQKEKAVKQNKKRSQTIDAGVKGANSLTAIRDVDFDANIQNFWANVK